MTREPQHLQTARETLLENSALAMEEQRICSQVLQVARKLRHGVRRMALDDGVLGTGDRETLRLADLVVQGCEMSLVLDVRDEEMLRGGNRALDAYSRQLCGHKSRRTASFETVPQQTLQS